MQLFTINSKTYEVEVQPEALLLKPFKIIYNRDRSKRKEKAMKELAFIYFVADIRSDYQYITDEDIRREEIVKDLQLKDWSPDSKIEEAISFYKERSSTIKSALYEAVYQSVSDINDYLRNTAKHLSSGELDIAKVTTALTKVPIIMHNIDEAYKELVKEQRDREGRSKGSKVFNTFEEGLL